MITCETIYKVDSKGKVREWQSEGGTWYTHDYAEKKGVDIVTIWPSAEVNQLIGMGR
jgi:hypothetical protein